MELYDVQITTEFGEEVILQVSASSPHNAEMTAISIAESGQAGTDGMIVLDCFVLN